MTRYRRNFLPAGSYFFTVNLVECRLTLLTDHIQRLRNAFRYTRTRHPFVVEAIVVLPDYRHAIWTLPENDAGFATRWRSASNEYRYNGLESTSYRDRRRASLRVEVISPVGARKAFRNFTRRVRRIKPMYQLLLGPAFHSLPQSIRTLHRSPGTHRFTGECTVRRGDTLLSQLFARAASLPPAGMTALTLTVESNEKHEVWVREFGSYRMRSFLRAQENRLYESLGLARFIFELTVDDSRIRWTLLEVGALGVKLPKRWFNLDVSEYERDGRYHFNVQVNIRGAGLLVHYCGWLA
jgi:REP element-mobilizing transposase RayT